jgi:crotonobetainyl-CoA:carnitine CoA-transferase CaiB-like acyl-CoA transferase
MVVHVVEQPLPSIEVEPSFQDVAPATDVIWRYPYSKPLSRFWATIFRPIGKKQTLPEKCGSGHESLCPYQAFDARDAPLLLGIANDNLWRRFCRAVERHELAIDLRFETNPARVAHFAETVSTVQAIIGTRSRDEWIQLLNSIGVPCAPINTLRDLLEHPHTGARGIILDYEHPELGMLKAVAQPIVFDGAERRVTRPPPLHGKHSREILEELGYSSEAIQQLVQTGSVVVSDDAVGKCSTG